MAKGDGGRGRGFLTEEEKLNKPKITKALLLRIFSYLSPYWLRLFLVFLTIMVSAVLGLLPSILTGRIIDEGLIGKDLNQLILLIGASFVVLVAANVIGVLESYLNISMAQNITFDMRNRLYAHLQKMSHRFFTTSKQGDIITRMTSDINGVQSVISGTLTSILSNIAILVTSAIAMYQKNWILATIGIMIVPLFVIPTKRVGKTRWMIATQTQQKNDEINQVLHETLSVSGQMLSKLFTNEPLEYDKYKAANQEMTRLTIKENMAGRWFRVAMSTYTSVGPMLIYLAGGILMIKYGNTTLSVGDITMMVTLLARLYQPVNSLLNIQVDVIRSMAMFTRIFEYFDMPVEIEDRPNAVSPTEVQGTLSFDQVDFNYDSGQSILKKVSFNIPAGRSVAIVGSSGAGKSTMINLIPRLYDVTGGSIRLDGTDIRDLNLASLRSSIGVVTQDTYLFNGTIKENLLYAKADATDAELIWACREANIHDFIAGLPNGYETLVGNRGVKLSGGEKQRVSIARVILKNPKLIILDEATSSLDSISESLIQEAIEPLLKGKTSIIIAHRLSTIMAADEILVLKSGEIVERGAHEDLVTHNGDYHELYETQFRRALEDHEKRAQLRSAT
jgi:ATP-binding cassette subfamily B protein